MPVKARPPERRRQRNAWLIGRPRPSLNPRAPAAGDATRASLDTPAAPDYAAAPSSQEADLATHVSARKRARQAEKRRIRNRHIRSGVKSLVKAVHAALEARSDESPALARRAEGAIRRAASKGVLTRKQASRRIARLARRAHQVASAKA